MADALALAIRDDPGVKKLLVEILSTPGFQAQQAEFEPAPEL